MAHKVQKLNKGGVINGKKAHPVQKMDKGGVEMPTMRKNKPGTKVKKQDFAPQFK